MTNRKCVKARLIGSHEEDGYINLGWKLEDKDEYLITTVCPNWRGKMPEYGEVGIVEYELAIAGVTSYFDTFHKYTAIYFINFVPVVVESKTGEILIT